MATSKQAGDAFRRHPQHAAPRQRVTLEFESALRQNVSNSSPDARAGERASPWALRRRGGHVVCYLGRRRVPSVARKVSQVTPRSRPCRAPRRRGLAEGLRFGGRAPPVMDRPGTGAGLRKSSGQRRADERREARRSKGVVCFLLLQRPAVEQPLFLFRTDRAPRQTRAAASMCRSTQSPAKAPYKQPIRD
jgi:hypothetical protein